MGQVRDVEQHRRRLQATFQRAKTFPVGGNVDEVKSDYAKYLCILVCGWIEKAVGSMIVAYASDKSPQQLQSHLESSLKRLTNVGADKLLVTMGTFDKQWRDRLEVLLTDEQTIALNSIVGLRNDIAHGGGGSLSLHGVERYWTAAQEAIAHFEEILLPANRPIVHKVRRKLGK
jgi:RiboL-PSP-HEPN